MGKELYNTYPVAKAVFIEGSDILPDSYAGHSVGEYAAPACSGAMRFEDGLSLIRRRGQLMQKVSDDMGDGGMLAIMGMAYPEVEELTEACVKDGTDVSISTYNDIRQIVISGRKGALKSAGERFEAAGAKTKMLTNPNYLLNLFDKCISLSSL